VLNGEVATAVFEVREDDNGVREEMTVTMVCRTRILVSCNSEERRLELGAEAMRFWTRAGTTAPGRFWGWRSYQTMGSVEAIVVAK
jgi:hypothetical protein